MPFSWHISPLPPSLTEAYFITANITFISSSLLSTSFAWYSNASVTASTVKAMDSVSNWRWSSYLFSIYFRRSFFTQTCHGCCLFFILTNKQQWIEDNKLLWQGLYYSCVATIAYNQSFFTKELDVCKDFSCKWQNHSYASNKYLF